MKSWENMECKYQLISDCPRKIPVLFFGGNRDKTLPIQTKRFKEKLVPHAKIEVYENHTHIFPIEYPEKVAQSMNKFFAEEQLAHQQCSVSDSRRCKLQHYRIIKKKPVLATIWGFILLGIDAISNLNHLRDISSEI